MMDWLDFARWLHVIGASVILGTGAGIAFFMLMAHRTKRAAIIAHTASVVVIADIIFTATAVIIQPMTGLYLTYQLGWSLTEGWIVLSILLYILAGVFWLPVIWIQVRMRDIARQAVLLDAGLPREYSRLFSIWFVCGFPAFGAVLLIIWLMLTQPDIDIAIL